MCGSRYRGVSSPNSCLMLLLLCCAGVAIAVPDQVADQKETVQQQPQLESIKRIPRSFVFPSSDEKSTNIEDTRVNANIQQYSLNQQQFPLQDQNSGQYVQSRQLASPFHNNEQDHLNSPTGYSGTPQIIPVLGTGRNNNPGHRRRRKPISRRQNGPSSQGNDNLIKTLGALISMLPRDNSTIGTIASFLQPVIATTAAPSRIDQSKNPLRQGLDGFSLSDLVPDGLSALEGLDDLLRSTVPRVDRFNCLERIMCELASPLDEDETQGNFLDDGVQTLQQISSSPLLQQIPQFLGGGQQAPHRQDTRFIRPHQQLQHQQQHHAKPHQQQFLLQQQHQQRLINKQLQQQQQHQQQQNLPYYLPSSSPAAGSQQFEYAVPRGTQEEEQQQQREEYQNNNIRRDEQHQAQASSPQQDYQQHPQQHQPQQHQYHHQQQQHHQQQYQHPYHQQHQAQQHHQQYYPQQRQQQQQHPQQQFVQGPPRRKRQPPAWRRLLNNVLGRNQNPSRNSHHRNKRDTLDQTNPASKTQKEEQPIPQRSSRQSKIAREFKNEAPVSHRQSKIDPKFKAEAPASKRQSKIDPKFTTDLTESPRQSKLDDAFKTKTPGAKPKETGPSPVKTLTQKDLEVIKSRIAAINAQVLRNSNSVNGTSSSGRHLSSRQARFLDTLFSGWSAKSLLGVLDNLMDGYSFHPYTHAAYKGFTSREGTCRSMYPRCPDNANDMLDFVNNVHRYFPDGIPFKDSLPWPINLLVP